MNKYEEALNSIEEKTTKTIEYPLTPAIKFRYCGDEVDILQELVDKATPKKTSCSKPFNIPHLNIDITFGKCPTCGSSLAGQQAYCTKCGQAIDWIENNEVMESVNNV